MKKFKSVLMAIIPIIFLNSFICNGGWKEQLQSKFNSLKTTVARHSNLITAAGQSSLAICAALLATHLHAVKDIAIGAGNLGLAGASLYGFKYWQHKSKLDQIQRIIDLSRTAQSIPRDDVQFVNTFRFCTWSLIKWPTAATIIKNKKEVIEQLENDALSSFVPIVDTNGDKINSNVIIADHILQAIEREQKELRSYLEYIDNLSGAAELFINKFRLFPELKETCSAVGLLPQEKIIGCADIILKKYDNAVVNAVVTQVKNTVSQKKNSFVLMNSYKPWQWSIAPLEEKSTAVYATVLKMYIRLLAIKEVAKELDFKSKCSGAIKHLLQEMINEQPQINDDFNRHNKQVARLVTLQTLLDRFKQLVKPDNYPIVEAMTLDLNTVGKQLQDKVNKWSDDIVRHLTTIYHKLGSLK